MTNSRLLLTIINKSATANFMSENLARKAVDSGERINSEDIIRIREIRDTLQEAVSAAIELDRVSREKTTIEKIAGD